MVSSFFVFALTIITTLLCVRVTGDAAFGISHSLTTTTPLYISYNSTGGDGSRFILSSSVLTPWLNMVSANNFAILAASTITNTGASTCNGNLGLTGTSVDGGIDVTGTRQIATGAATTALDAANNARVTLAGLPCDTTWGGAQQNLGGVTLTPGVVCWIVADVFVTGGDLIMDAQGDINAYWVIKVSGDITIGAAATAVNIKVINGGSPCNVYWVMGSKATIYKGCSVVGSVLAYAEINMNLGANVFGRVFSLTEQVTMQANVIDVAECSSNLASLRTIDVTITAAARNALSLPAKSTLIYFNYTSAIGLPMASAGYQVAGTVTTSGVTRVASPTSVTIMTPPLTTDNLALIRTGLITVLFIAPTTTTGFHALNITKPTSSLNVGDSLTVISSWGNGAYYFVVSDSPLASTDIANTTNYPASLNCTATPLSIKCTGSSVNGSSSTGTQSSSAMMSSLPSSSSMAMIMVMITMMMMTMMHIIA